MNRSNLVFSIVLCTYNGSSKIKNAIESLLSQDFPKERYEVIVVNDGSKDDTVKIAKAYSIRLLSHETNRGISSARNTGLKAARGHITVCVDDDCSVSTNFLSEIYTKYLNENVMGVSANLIYPRNCGFVDKYLASIWYGVSIPEVKEKQKGTLNRLLWYYQNSPWTINRRGYIDNVKLIDIPAACSSYRTELIRKVGGWDERLVNSSEDNDLTSRMINKFKNFDLILSMDALVTHYPNLSLFDILRREFERGQAKINYYKKSNLFPSIFPNPLILICLAPLLFISFGLYIIVPFLVYPWWTYRYTKEKDVRFLMFPYMQLLHESAANLSLIYGLVKKI